MGLHSIWRFQSRWNVRTIKIGVVAKIAIVSINDVEAGFVGSGVVIGKIYFIGFLEVKVLNQ